MTNTKGSYYSTPERTMAAFDKLPRMVREALRNADEHYATQPILTRWKRGRTGEQLVADIKRLDSMRRASRVMTRVWGAGHPQSIEETKAQISKALRGAR